MENLGEEFLAEEEIDQINSLPDEVLLLIFNKLLDAKCLCRCFSVCKRFSLIISHIQSVCLTMPYHNNTSCPNYHNHPRQDMNLPTKVFGFLVDNFFSRPFRYLNQIVNRQKLPPLPFNLISFRSATGFLKKIKAIRNLYLEVPSLYGGDSVLKWYGVFGKGSSSCIILFATSFHEENTKEYEVTTNLEWLTLTNELLRSRVESASQRFREAQWRHHILHHLVEDHGKLENAVITDLKKEGKVCLGEKQILDLRDAKHLTRPPSGYMKVLHVPVLQLPLSGYIMEAATVIVIRPVDLQQQQQEGNDVLYTLMERAFEGEELVFREAVKLIYENHEDNIITLDINLT